MGFTGEDEMGDVFEVVDGDDLVYDELWLEEGGFVIHKSEGSFLF